MQQTKTESCSHRQLCFLGIYGCLYLFYTALCLFQTKAFQKFSFCDWNLVYSCFERHIYELGIYSHLPSKATNFTHNWVKVILCHRFVIVIFSDKKVIAFFISGAAKLKPYKNKSRKNQITRVKVFFCVFLENRLTRIWEA